MNDSTEKLQKVLARCGLGSRREIERRIAAGSITINGQVAKLGDRVGTGDKVIFAGRPIALKPLEQQHTRVLIYHKPEGEICTRNDPEKRPTVFARMPKLANGRWVAVGRLDINSSGLMLFTNDGELANRLMHPSTSIDREYLVRVFGEVVDSVRDRLLSGVQLEDGVARFTDLSEGGGEGINKWFYVTVMEGRNRLVRRLWESQGIRVSRLKRVRFGSIFLPSAVKQGRHHELTQQEIEALCHYANIPLPADFAPAVVADEAEAGRPAGRGQGARRTERKTAKAGEKPSAPLKRAARQRNPAIETEAKPARSSRSATTEPAEANRTASRSPRRPGQGAVAAITAKPARREPSAPQRAKSPSADKKRR